MKDPRLWEEEDIIKLIEIGATESPTLEFKSSDALGKADQKKREIAKDVSAFANADGGTIVYGLVESRTTHEAERIDQGYDPTELSELWLEQVIDSNIQRRIEGLEINRVALRQTSPGRVLFVVCIPSSNRAPHMANHKYYKRHNYQSVEMEEYEVREKYGRDIYPGRDVVEAWRDDAINPLLATLGEESDRLESETWTWVNTNESFSGFYQLGNQSAFSANHEQFLARYPEVSTLLRDHDSALTIVNDAGRALFADVTKGMKEAFQRATFDENLGLLSSKYPNRFKGTTPDEIFEEIFGANWKEQERLERFAEWAINGHAQTNNEPMVIFWQEHGETFCALAKKSERIKGVIGAREALLDVNNALTQSLKKIRQDLSERYNMRVMASSSGTDASYCDPLGTRRY